ncbi:MAG: hypothetical protein LUH63_01805 [Parabacteroides sp.]|nr:hypothetical protein [Parabacteroides sp.]
MNVQEKRKMKQWLLPLLLFVPMFFAGGCNSDEDGGFDPSDYMEVELLPLSGEHKNYFYTDPWRTWETFKNQKGIIVMRELGDEVGELRIETSHSDPQKKQYLGRPLNIPEEYWIEGVEIVFSGETRDHPLIDLNVLPFFLTDLKVKKNGVIK